MLWHCVDTSPMWLCSHPGECSHPLSCTCQFHRMSLVGWHVQMCLLTSIFLLLVLFMSQPGRFMSLNPASLSVQALSVPSLSSLSDTTLLSHSHSIYQIPWYHTSLPLDALTPSALPMVCKASHQQGPHTTSHWNSPRLPIKCLVFRRGFRTSHRLSSHSSASLHQPRTSDSTRCACFFCTRKGLPFLSKAICPVASVLSLQCPWHQPWGCQLSDLSMKKRRPLISLIECARMTSRVMYRCPKPSTMTLMPLAFPWIQM